MKNIISVLAQNKPGVLSKITGLLRRKCFVIDSLTFNSTTNDKDISKLEVSIIGDKTTSKRAINQLEKIIEVISIELL